LLRRNLVSSPFHALATEEGDSQCHNTKIVLGRTGFAELPFATGTRGAMARLLTVLPPDWQIGDRVLWQTGRRLPWLLSLPR
jgi:hypothetical protein